MAVAMKAVPPTSVGFLLGLLLDLEDGGSMFLQNIRRSLNHMALETKTLLFVGFEVLTTAIMKSSALVYNSVWSDGSQLTFQRNMSPPS
jgi:hypothetical protein